LVNFGSALPGAGHQADEKRICQGAFVIEY